MVSHDASTHPPEESSDTSRMRAQGLDVATEHFHWRIPTKPELIEKVVMQLKDRAEACGVVSGERVTGLVIALTEALTNALVHGNLEISSDVRERTDGEYGRMLATRCSDDQFSARPVEIDVEWDGHACAWTITDAGHGFDVESMLKKLDSSEPDATLASGRGILLMRAFMDDVQYALGGRQVRLVMATDTQADHAAEGQHRVRQAVKAKGFENNGEGSADMIATSMSPDGMAVIGAGLKGVRKSSRLMIELDLDGERTLVPVEVRHVNKLTADWVQIDCRFCRDKESEANAAESERTRAALEQILQRSRRAADAGDERRQAERFLYTEVLRIERKDGTVVHGMARDLSRGGLAFIANFELQRGEVVMLTLEPEHSEPVRVAAEVMRSQQLAGVYRDIGVRFLIGGRG